jgi:hypothetical protein
MVGSFIVTIKTESTDIFAPGSLVIIGNFIFHEDGIIRTFRDTGAAVDAFIRVNIHPGPLFNRFAGDDAINRANFDTSSIP